MNDPNFHRAVQLIYKINFDQTEQAVRAALLEMPHYHTGNTILIAEYLLVLQARAGIPAMPAMQATVHQNGQLEYHQAHQPQYQAPAPMPPQPYQQQMPAQAPQAPPQGYQPQPPDPTQLPPNVDQAYMGQPTTIRSPIVGGGPAGSDDGGRTLGNSIDPNLLNRTEFREPTLDQVQPPAPQPGEQPQSFKQGDIPLSDVPANPAAPQPPQIPNYDLWRREDMDKAAKDKGVRTVSHMKDSTLARKLRNFDMDKLPLDQQIAASQAT